jgi:hypothetical protein
MDSLASVVYEILDHIEAGTLRVGFEIPIERGSASGAVSIVENPGEPESPVVFVRLTIMKVPEDVAGEFFRRLLELNQAFKGRAAFSVQDDLVMLVAGRSVGDLDPGELIDLILWTSEQADHFDDVLLTEFGYEYAL